MSTNNGAEIRIAVMGMTGTGKSTFINRCTQSEGLGVGDEDESYTTSVDKADPFELDGRRVILFDTPGFGDNRGELEDQQVKILTILGEELLKQYQENTLLNGILYFYDVSHTRRSHITTESFELFRKMCGEDTLNKVLIVTTMWSKVPTAAERAKKIEKLNRQDPKNDIQVAVSKGANLVHHYDNTTESAHAIIRQLLGSSPAPINIQEELAAGKPLGDTTAGQAVNKQLNKFKEEYEKKLKAFAEGNEKDREKDRQLYEDKIKDVERNQEKLIQERVDVALARAAQVREQERREQERPFTLQTITSGKTHTMRHVGENKYATLDRAGRYINGEDSSGSKKQKWVIQRCSGESGHWTIKSSSSGTYLSTSNNGGVCASTNPQEWSIRRTNTYGRFRLYDPAREKAVCLPKHGTRTEFTGAKSRRAWDIVVAE